MIGFNGLKVAGGWRKLHNEALHNSIKCWGLHTRSYTTTPPIHLNGVVIS